MTGSCLVFYSGCTSEFIALRVSFVAICNENIVTVTVTFIFCHPKKKSIFDIHDPTGTRILFQFRLGLSPLRSHKKRYKFIDTPLLLAVSTTVIPILISNNLNRLANDENLYLYGHNSINDNDNKAILVATIKFLKATNRFSI